MNNEDLESPKMTFAGQLIDCDFVPMEMTDLDSDCLVAETPTVTITFDGNVMENSFLITDLNSFKID